MRLVAGCALLVMASACASPPTGVDGATIDMGPPFLVRDIAGGSASGVAETARIADGGGILFFTADDRVKGEQLWRSDGTAFGTRPLTDVTGGTDRFDKWTGGFGSVGPQLFFTVDDGGRGRDLWRSDGADAVVIKDIRPGPPSYGRDLVVDVAGSLFLVSQTAGSRTSSFWQLQLLRSDGTPEGTTLVKELGEYFTSHQHPNPAYMAAVAFRGQMFLVVENDLWRSDGTAAGTHVIFPRLFTPERLRPLAAVGDQLLFVTYTDWPGARDPRGAGPPPDLRNALWTSDGTAAGTRVVRSFDQQPSSLIAAGSTVFLGVGNSLWVTDGTASGTARVMSGGEPFLLGAADGAVVFAMGSELWHSNGVTHGARLLRRGLRFVHRAVAARGRFFFTADDDLHGRELWMTDGTPEGTRLVADLRPGAESSFPMSYTVSGDRLYFSADDGRYGRELWALPLLSGGGR